MLRFGACHQLCNATIPTLVLSSIEALYLSVSRSSVLRILPIHVVCPYSSGNRFLIVLQCIREGQYEVLVHFLFLQEHVCYCLARAFFFLYISVRFILSSIRKDATTKIN